jgi:predicted Fe-S protein YdhL (DUF1289 family)
MIGAPSPCIDVCKYKLRGHCIGCGMTKMQKTQADRLLDPDAMRQFIAGLKVQQAALGRPFWGWEGAYRQKCARHGVPCLLDEARDAADQGAGR